MQVMEAIRTRRSIRAYKPDPVPEDVLLEVLDAARLAPSAGNRQPWLFVVVRDQAVKDQLKHAYGAEWFYTAPVIICACGFPDRAWTRSDGKNYVDVDVTIAMDHLILAAWEKGLGTCWIGAFDAAKTKEILNLPEGCEPIAMTPLGYPAEEPPAKPRKALEEITKFV
ncbi:MAG: nitroreductase family protein [Armatimonadetes bacterium]|nr:nitroreductase family protein [Armatimonadota bacterium]